MPIASIKSILKVFTLRLVSYTLSPIFNINSDLFKCLTTCNTLITNTLRFFDPDIRYSDAPYLCDGHHGRAEHEPQQGPGSDLCGSGRVCDWNDLPP